MGECCSNGGSEPTIEFGNDNGSVKKRIYENVNENFKNKKDHYKRSKSSYKKGTQTCPLNNSSSITDEYSNFRGRLHYLINQIRVNPKAYIEQSEGHMLKKEFENLKPGQPLIFSDEKYIEIKEYLNNKVNMDKPLIEKEQEIFELLNVSKDSACRFQSVSKINREEDNIWSLLENNSEEIGKIISENFDYLLIVCQKMEADEQVLTTYIFYNKE